jgi:hypothetical protein
MVADIFISYAREDAVRAHDIVDFGDQARTSAVIAAVQEEGTCWCGPTTWRGRAAMRVSVSCWNTAEEDIDRSVAAVVACASRLRRAPTPPRHRPAATGS